MSFLGEIKSIRDFFKLSKQEREIVFYAEHDGYYVSFEGLINEISKTYPHPLCYITSSLRDGVLNGTNSRVRPFYINKLLPLFMQIVDSKIFVMTLSNLNRSYIKRSRYPVHYVYAFHALVSTHMVYNFGAFDYYDSMLCVGPHHIREIKKQEELYNLRPKKLVEAGYYRLEKIMNSFQQYKLSIKQTDDKKKTILIAPSWGDKNILESFGYEITDSLLDSGYNVIVRPHSETVKRSSHLIRKLEEVFGRHPNFTLEKSNASDRSIIIADILISDYSGISLEYAFGTERPVIFIDVPLKIKNKRFQELNIEPLELFLRPKIGKIVSSRDLKFLPMIVEDLMASQKQYKKDIIELRERSIFNLGHSSKIGAEYILSLLS